ncbi:MAG: AAA family ATPase [Magnetococcales bacterium]|nr:AAA family ATPase [Magnetococcales bacterium]
MFTRLILTNFTVFKSLDIQFSQGINVFVGANGTGKTHLLKLLYCLQACQSSNRRSLDEKLGTVFRPRDNDFRRLTRRRSGRTVTKITVEMGQHSVKANWHNASDGLAPQFPPDLLLEQPVYIPVKEVLSFAPGFISLYDKYEMAFDEVYYDILKMAYLPVRKGKPAEENRDILEKIRQLIGGRVVTEGDAFFLNHQSANLEMHLVAEGYRKLALIWQLIHNGSLLTGTTLFWDEPEANLNPSLMQHVANILILLANRGIQVFLATHNFAFLKELDLLKQRTPVTYFAMDDSGPDGVTANSCSSYAAITPNKIAEEYLRIYDQEMEQAFKGGH